VIFNSICQNRWFLQDISQVSGSYAIGFFVIMHDIYQEISKITILWKIMH